MKVFVGLVAAVAVCAALYLARTLFAPVTFALLVITVVYPLQSVLERGMPKLLAACSMRRLRRGWKATASCWPAW